MSIGWDTMQVGGKAVRVYLGAPATPGEHPGVVVAHHGPGIDAGMQDMVHRLVREGYAAAAPDLFHRQPESGLEMAQRISMLRDNEILADIGAAAAKLRDLGPSVQRLGVIGFCMGGRVAFLSACEMPEFKAAAVFYGGNIMKPLGEGPSPLERAAGIRCPVIGFFGARDTNPSPEDVRRIDAELTRLGKWHEFHTYNDAEHAFHNFSGTRYRERAARASWHELLAFFAQYLERGETADM